MNFRAELPAEPSSWSWSVSYDTWHLGAINADYEPGDAGFELAFTHLAVELDARLEELRQDGWPEAIIQHARALHDQGVASGDLGKPHKPSWER